MTVVLIGAIVPLLWIAAGQLRGQGDRVSALDQDRVAFDDMTRLIRGAKSVQPLDQAAPTPPGAPLAAGKLQLTTGDPDRDPVLIDCGVPGSESGRYACRISTGDGAAKSVIDGITDPAPFTVDPDRGFVAVTLQMSPAGASRPVTLKGGVNVRTGEVFAGGVG